MHTSRTTRFVSALMLFAAGAGGEVASYATAAAPRGEVIWYAGGPADVPPLNGGDENPKRIKLHLAKYHPLARFRRFLNGEWHQVCAQLKTEQNLGALGSPLILVGQSYGGQATVDTARCLAENNIRVDLAITIDTIQKWFHSPGNQIPENVERNPNYYQRQDLMLRGYGDNHRKDGSQWGITNQKVTTNSLSPHLAIVGTLLDSDTIQKHLSKTLP